VSFVAAKPGKGVAMHLNDTVESFLFIKGKWKLEFELDKGTDYVILGPLDFIARPIGVEHRFECIEADPGEEEGLMLTIVAGDRFARDNPAHGRLRHPHPRASGSGA